MNPVYSEAEIGEIIQRAAERQRAEAAGRPVTAEAGRGLSLEEIQRAAAEVGIEPRHIAEAAREVRGGNPAPLVVHADRARDRIEVERTYALVVTPEAWADIVLDAERTFDTAEGVSSEAGGTLEWRWHEADEDHDVRLTLSPRGGGTRLRIQQTSSGPVSAAVWGGIGGLILALVNGLVGGAWGVSGWLVVPLVVALGAAAAYALAHAVRQRKLKKLEALSDRIEARLVEGAALTEPRRPEPLPEPASEPARPALALSDPDPAPEEPPASPSETRTRA